MKAYYDGTSENTMHLRAVVGANGNVVPRNYNPQAGKKGSLQSGDVGITVSIHGDTSNMTSAQAGAARAMAVQMGGRVKERLGMDTQLGFVPGMVVRVTNVPMGGVSDIIDAVVEGTADGGLYVRVFTDDFRATRRAYVPLYSSCVEEVPGLNGLEGLLIQMFRRGLKGGDEAIVASEYAFSLLRSKEACLEALRGKITEPVWRALLERLDDVTLRELVVAPEHGEGYARPEVKEDALLFIEDHDVLESLARRFLRENQRMFEAALLALERAEKDQERLIRLFEDSRTDQYPRCIVGWDRESDEPQYKDCPESDRRNLILARIHDQTWLTAYVLGSGEDASTPLRAKAIENIEDCTVLKKLCEEGCDDLARAAAKRLKELAGDSSERPEEQYLAD